MSGTSPELDLRRLPPEQRHGLVFQTFDGLQPGQSLVLVNDHDPMPLLQQFKFVRPGQSESEYLVRGPVEWRVRIGRKAPAARPDAAAADEAETVSDYLERDHRRLDAILPDVERLASAGSYPDSAARFQVFASGLDRHIEAEEQVLFPEFERLTGAAAGPTTVMRSEHVQIRDWMRRISGALAAGDGPGAAAALDELTAVLSTHNMKEERMLYPMADQAAGSDRERAELVRRMRAI